MVVLVLVIIAFLVLVVVVGTRIDQAYRRELQAWAAARGWAYRGSGGGTWTKFLPEGGRSNGVKFQLDGIWQGRPMILADYWYQTVHQAGRRTRATNTNHLTVAVIQLATAYPPMVLRSRTFGSLGLSVAKAVGAHPANLTGIPEFDRRFRIEAGWPAGNQLVTARVAQATLQGNLPPWQLHGRELIMFWPGPLHARDLDHRISWVLALAIELERVAS